MDRPLEQSGSWPSPKSQQSWKGIVELVA